MTGRRDCVGRSAALVSADDDDDVDDDDDDDDDDDEEGDVAFMTDTPAKTISSTSFTPSFTTPSLLFPVAVAPSLVALAEEDDEEAVAVAEEDDRSVRFIQPPVTRTCTYRDISTPIYRSGTGNGSNGSNDD